MDIMARCEDQGTRNFVILSAVAVLVVSLIVPTTIVHTQAAKASTRPIEDFVSVQGTFCFPDGSGGCLIFVPPIPNYGGWGNLDLTRCASVDYAGISNAWIESASGGAISFGTTTDGSITERPLADGRAEVTVMLNTHNALTWVISNCADFATDPLLFGHRATEVLNDGATAALGESTLKLVFINTALGAPMPDLIQLFVAPEPGQEPKSLSLKARADGTLSEAFGVAEGTPGKATIVQVGFYSKNFNPKSHVVLGDPNFTVERVDLQATGN
jgi:hypothetical protein